MFGIFVNSNGIRYALAIVGGYKPIETRSRNMLKNLIGKRVAVIETRSGKKPVVIGYVTIVDSRFCPAAEFDKYRNLTCIPVGSRYDCKGKGKWFYYLEKPEKCSPYELPKTAVYHGRSYCEF